MLINVSDFYHLHEGALSIVAGAGGLIRPVKSVGILDYELMPGLKNKYQRVNFCEGQLILSTFLYAHDDAYYIGEAIRYLVDKGTSGLVIKNVFHLQIPDSALRFANARNYPIFVTTADDFFFDEVIVDVARRVERIASASEMERVADSLRDEAGDPNRDLTRTRELVRGLNPSFLSECLVVWAPSADGLTADAFLELERAFQTSRLYRAGNVFFRYRDGVMLIASWDPLGEVDEEGALQAFRDEVLPGGEAPLGASALHETTDELPEAIGEALVASEVASVRGQSAVRYERLGTLSVVLSAADSPSARVFERRVLEPLRVHDAETNAHLEETLRAYIDANCSAAETGRLLGQHPNTVRYRLDRVTELTKLDYRVPDQFEQLRMAEEISFCRDILARV